ncbi:hypothetical protein BG006_004823 [Podila minutissima]|uniref:FAD-binding domain-containing protein n=1 Tax=Podila minutissima TaxID=64525 RepID=A0A9P5SKR1_9FUNG|nr:hypothetical protein BG006_004823 [Podila minutissima]
MRCSAMSMGSSIFSFFKQLDLYEEFLAISKPTDRLLIYSEHLDLRYVMDFGGREKVGGSPDSIVARPDLYNLLLRQIPKENIHMGKKVLSTLQNEHGVVIRCSDDSTYGGDILVGADGAYSAVRQHLYVQLKKEKRLPSSDDVPMPFSCVCLVGQTKVLDPEEFPDLKLPLSRATALSGGGDAYKWSTYVTAQNTFCWTVVHFLDIHSAKDTAAFRSSGWGSEAAEAMCKQVRDFKVPIEHGGGNSMTIGDLIDRTPKERISKVMLEEKLNPSGGAGALTAMHDAVALANWICALEPRSLKDLAVVFKEYQAERHPVAKELFAFSQFFGKMGGKSLTGKLIVAATLYMPKWLWSLIIGKAVASRPQVSFLPLVKDTGRVKPKYQPSLHKTLEIFKKKASQTEGKDAVRNPIAAT